MHVCATQSREALECVCVLHSLERHSVNCAAYTRVTGKYAAKTQTTSISTDKIEPLL